jgi:hypothetical protein
MATCDGLGAAIRKRAEVVVVAVLMLFTPGCSAKRMETERTRLVETEVLEAFNELVEASRALDSQRYFACFDKEKFTGLNVDGKVWHSIEALERLVSPGFSQVEEVVSLEFHNVKVTVVNPATAILVNEFRETSRLKDGTVVTQAGGGVQVWARSGSTWKLVSVAASEARP